MATVTGIVVGAVSSFALSPRPMVGSSGAVAVVVVVDAAGVDVVAAVAVAAAA